jgi:hypothetical protein
VNLAEPRSPCIPVNAQQMPTPSHTYTHLVGRATVVGTAASQGISSRAPILALISLRSGTRTTDRQARILSDAGKSGQPLACHNGKT